MGSAAEGEDEVQNRRRERSEGSEATARRPRSRPPGTAALLVLLAVLVAACGDDSGAAGADELTVVATTGILADIVGNVAGEDLEVEQLIPDGASPHSYSPSAAEQGELTEAGLLVYTSPALEEALPLEGARASFALAEHVDSSGSPSADDPHVWLDPTLIASALPDLAASLGELDPANAEAYADRAEAYADELGDLDVALARTLDAVPPENRKLVTSHDVIGYYADRYGFEFVGAPFGVSPEAEASAGGIAELIEMVESEDVPAVFAQAGDDPEVLRRVAEEAGVVVVDDLLLESLSDEAPSYAEMLAFSTAKIADALSG